MRGWNYQISSWRNRHVQSRRVYFFIINRNYGPTLGTTKDANKKGHQQVLWLYNDRKIIEVGASNIFFVFKSKNGKKA